MPAPRRSTAQVQEVPGGEAGGRAAAFFDLDKTLMAGSSGLQFARAAYRAGMLSRSQLLSDGWANLRFRLAGSTDEKTDEVRARIGEAIAGVRVRDLERLAPDVLAGVLPRVYPQMLQVAYEHQDAGRPVYIVTAAAHELAGMLATVLAFDGGIGARAEVVDGVYTGRPGGVFTYREGKATALAELAAAEGFDLERCWAYSDSESDLPMLRAVGHPVAVNPDTALRRVAREQGWEVLTFDRLNRRLRIAAGALAAAALGGIGQLAISRRASRIKRVPALRRRRPVTRAVRSASR